MLRTYNRFLTAGLVVEYYAEPTYDAHNGHPYARHLVMMPDVLPRLPRKAR